MSPELTLNMKCPACGVKTEKSLSQIKAQREFHCDCGYFADLSPRPMPKRKDLRKRTHKKEAVA